MSASGVSRILRRVRTLKKLKLPVKLGLILGIIVLLSGGVYAGMGLIVSDDELTGLRHHWKLNGDMTDEVAGRNGTPVGSPTLTTDHLSNSNRAYSFNGTSQAILLPAGAFDLATATSEITLAAWLRVVSDADCDGALFGGRSDGNGTPVIDLTIGNNGAGNDGTCRPSFLVRGTNGNGIAQITSATSVNDGNWHHIVATRTSAKVITLYVDGVQVAQTTDTMTSGIQTTHPRLMYETNPDIGYLSGELADARIYSRALMLSEINEIMANSENEEATISVASTQQRLLAHWKLDGDAMDTTPNGLNATVSGASLTTDRKSRSSTAYSFDGVDDYLTAGDVADMGTGDLTVSTWFKTSDTDYSLVAKSLYNGTTGNTRWFCGVNESNGGLYAGIDYGPLIQSTPLSGYSDNQWHLLTCVFDRDADLTVYIDGVSQTSVSIAAASATDFQNAYALLFGRYNDATTGAGPHASVLRLNGSMDDIRIYNRTLSLAEIQRLYESYDGGIDVSDLQKGLAGQWNFSGDAKDDTPFSGNGVVTSATLTTDRKGKTSSAYSFTGSTGSQITIPSTFGLGTTNITISCWAYMSSTSLHGAFIKIGSTTNGIGLGIGNGVFENDGNEVLGLFEGVRWIDSNTNVGTGWHHFALTIDGSGGPRLYLDGQLLNYYSGQNAIAPTTSTTTIGGYTGTGALNRFFNGTLDDVRIYRRQLSSTEITRLYETY